MPLVNGDFETGDLTGWTVNAPGGAPGGDPGWPPSTSNVEVHGGSWSAILGGSTAEQTGDCSISQDVVIMTPCYLDFWYWPWTDDEIDFDWQEVQIRDTSGGFLAQVFKVCSNSQTWTHVQFDLSDYVGQAIRLWFNAHGDGAGDDTYMYLDDIQIVNGQLPPPPAPPPSLFPDPDFHEIQFPVDLTDARGGSGYKGGPSFSTGIVIAESGKEQRYQQWIRSRAKYNVGYILKDDVGKEELLAFFKARGGKRFGFRFRDQFDYKVTETPVGFILSAVLLSGGSGYNVGDTGTVDEGDGTYEVTAVDGSGAVTAFAIVDRGTTYQFSNSDESTTPGGIQPGSGSGFTVNMTCGFCLPSGTIWSPSGNNPYQLARGYHDRFFDPATGMPYEYIRLISKPTTGSTPDSSGVYPPRPKLFVGGTLLVEGTDYDIDYTSGVVWLASDPGIRDLLNVVEGGSGFQFGWRGQFDVPVRFDTDVQELLLQNFQDTDWPSIELTELKMRMYPTPLGLPDALPYPQSPSGQPVYPVRMEPAFSVVPVGQQVSVRVRASNNVQSGTVVDVALASTDPTVATVSSPFVGGFGSTAFTEFGFGGDHDSGFMQVMGVAPGVTTVTATLNGKTIAFMVKVL